MAAQAQIRKGLCIIRQAHPEVSNEVAFVALAQSQGRASEAAAVLHLPRAKDEAALVATMLDVRSFVALACETTERRRLCRLGGRLECLPSFSAQPFQTAYADETREHEREKNDNGHYHRHHQNLKHQPRRRRTRWSQQQQQQREQQREQQQRRFCRKARRHRRRGEEELLGVSTDDSESSSSKTVVTNQRQGRQLLGFERADTSAAATAPDRGVDKDVDPGGGEGKGKQNHGYCRGHAVQRHNDGAVRDDAEGRGRSASAPPAVLPPLVGLDDGTPPTPNTLKTVLATSTSVAVEIPTGFGLVRGGKRWGESGKVAGKQEGGGEKTYNTPTRWVSFERTVQANYTAGGERLLFV